MGFRAYGLGFRVEGLEFRAYGLGFRVEGLELRVWGLGFRVANKRRPLKRPERQSPKAPEGPIKNPPRALATLKPPTPAQCQRSPARTAARTASSDSSASPRGVDSHETAGCLWDIRISEASITISRRVSLESMGDIALTGFGG